MISCVVSKGRPMTLASSDTLDVNLKDCDGGTFDTLSCCNDDDGVFATPSCYLNMPCRQGKHMRVTGERSHRGIEPPAILWHCCRMGPAPCMVVSEMWGF